MKSAKCSIILIIFVIRMIGNAQPGYYPPPSSVIFHNDTLTIFPADSLPGDPVVLLGYNIYVDSIFFDNIMDINPVEPVDYLFERPGLLPGNHSFCAKAFYNEWISEATCDSGEVIYGLELPFLEDWSSGGFEENLWVSTSGNWVVENDIGNPAPSANFNKYPVQTDYSASLESYPMIAIGQTLGSIWLDFKVKLDAVNATGNEQLLAQVWNWTTNSWATVEIFSNEDGSFDWRPNHINISYSSRNKVFRVRFLASGLNSAEINSWSIDNIHIYRKCDGASELQIYEHPEYYELQWMGPDGCGYDEWIHWDDGVNASNSIGTNEPVEFDVAARWTPAQLANYAGVPITQIAFFPAESAADYRARIWIGEGPDTLVLDEPVVSPLINQWNYFTLPEPIILDATRELWVGYNIVTPTGYPAGVDDGPAVNGYGNMIYFDSTWSTLIELNPELEFNWNIACHLGPYADDPHGYFKIFRQTNNEEFQVIGSTTDWYYQDNNINFADYYCYKVSFLWYTVDGDTCESNPSNTDCENMIGTGSLEQVQNIRIYPNPASKHITIEAQEEISEVRVYSLLGEMVLKLEIGNWEGALDVRRLENGIYFVEVVTASSTYKSKVLIIR